MEIIISSRNESKIEQIKGLFKGYGWTILSLTEAGIEENVEEDGTTLAENATKKAVFATQKTGKWAIADDTGVFIDALRGKPGIRAARWAGEGLSTEEIMRYTLQKLQGVPEEERTGTFATCAVLISPRLERNAFYGTVYGKFLTEPRTKCQPNMPYSSIFVPRGLNKVWAEMSVDEENTLSHRGQAFRKLRDYLATTL